MPIINNFNMSFIDMPASGESRSFEIQGGPGCIFSLEIKNEDGHYYNFDTEAFAAAKSGLRNKKIGKITKKKPSVNYRKINDFQKNLVHRVEDF